MVTLASASRLAKGLSACPFTGPLCHMLASELALKQASLARAQPCCPVVSSEGVAVGHSRQRAPGRVELGLAGCPGQSLSRGCRWEQAGPPPGRHSPAQSLEAARAGLGLSGSICGWHQAWAGAGLGVLPGGAFGLLAARCGAQGLQSLGQVTPLLHCSPGCRTCAQDAWVSPVPSQGKRSVQTPPSGGGGRGHSTPQVPSLEWAARVWPSSGDSSEAHLEGPASLGLGVHRGGKGVGVHRGGVTLRARWACWAGQTRRKAAPASGWEPGASWGACRGGAWRGEGPGAGRQLDLDSR